MITNKLIITWKSEILNSATMVQGTSRSEVETFNNVKTIEAAEKILLSRNTKKILFATYNGEEISVQPEKKPRKRFVKKQSVTKPSPHYSNNYSHL